MAVWNFINYTDKAQEYLTKIQAGEGSIKISHAKSGAVFSSNPNSLQTVLDPRQDVDITKVTPEGNNLILDLQISNLGLAESYKMYQVGVYAKYELNGTQEEFLYIIAQCRAGGADTIPAATESPLILNYRLQLTNSNTENIQLLTKPSGLVTVEEFNNLSAEQVAKQSGSKCLSMVYSSVAELVDHTVTIDELIDLLPETCDIFIGYDSESDIKIVPGEIHITNESYKDVAAYAQNSPVRINKYFDPGSGVTAICEFCATANTGMTFVIRYVRWMGQKDSAQEGKTSCTWHHINNTAYTLGLGVEDISKDFFASTDENIMILYKHIYKQGNIINGNIAFSCIPPDVNNPEDVEIHYVGKINTLYTPERLQYTAGLVKRVDDTSFPCIVKVGNYISSNTRDIYVCGDSKGISVEFSFTYICK